MEFKTLKGSTSPVALNTRLFLIPSQQCSNILPSLGFLIHCDAGYFFSLIELNCVFLALCLIQACSEHFTSKMLPSIPKTCKTAISSNHQLINKYLAVHQGVSAALFHWIQQVVYLQWRICVSDVLAFSEWKIATTSYGLVFFPFPPTPPWPVLPVDGVLSTVHALRTSFPINCQKQTHTEQYVLMYVLVWKVQLFYCLLVHYKKNTHTQRKALKTSQAYSVQCFFFFFLFGSSVTLISFDSSLLTFCFLLFSCA